MVVKMSNQIPEKVIQKVQNAHNIVEIVGEYVQLTKRGNNYFGLCPFHEEKTPSFSVSESKQMFYCFGCKEGGNIISFLMKLRGLTFYETITELADQANIHLHHIQRTEYEPSSEVRKLIRANEWLMKLYYHLLRFTKDGKIAYNYLMDRGITKESIETFQIGYSPNKQNFTAKFLQKKGVHPQTLVSSGLFVKQNNHQMFDRFSDRVVFPIRDHVGRTVGFSARSIHGQEPKYLNSAESEIFQKQHILYNFDLAKSYIRKEKEAILFEGQFDVITAYQHGLKNVVATLGTALTERQAQLLRRYTNKIIICYDGDSAGEEASFRAAKVLRPIGFDISIANLDNAEDPDQYILQKGIDTFIDRIINVSVSFITFYMKYLQNVYNLKNETERIEYIQEIIKEIALLKSSVEQDYYLRQLSEQHSISIDSLREDLQAYRQSTNYRKNKSLENRYTKTTTLIKQKSKLLPAYHNAERELISLMLNNVSTAKYIQNELGADFNIDEHKVIVTALYAFYEDSETPNISLFLERLEDEEIRNLAAEIAMIPTVIDMQEHGLHDYISVIKKQFNDVAIIDKYRQEQRLAEQQNNPIKAAKIGMKILEIQKQLKQSN